MKVFNKGQVPREEYHNPIFTGGPVTRQQMVTNQIAQNFTFTIINFSPGSRNYFHVHTSDQVLVITEGEGIIATEKEERVVREGDVVFIPAGEKHWHGATKESAMSHATITSVDNKTQQLEP